MGDGGFWHNGLITGVAVEPVQQGRRRADRDVQERLHLGHRHAAIICRPSARASARSAQQPGHARPSNRRCGALGVKWMRTVRTYAVAKMTKTLDEAMRTAERRPQGHHRRGRMPARAASAACAPRTPSRLKRGERVVRARYGVDDDDLHRRPFLHPAVGLPLAHRQAQPRPAAQPTRSRP